MLNADGEYDAFLVSSAGSTVRVHGRHAVFRIRRDLERLLHRRGRQPDLRDAVRIGDELRAVRCRDRFRAIPRVG